MGRAEPVPVLNQFIEQELERLEHVVPERFTRREVVSQLNGLFHATLGESVDSTSR